MIDFFRNPPAAISLLLGQALAKASQALKTRFNTPTAQDQPCSVRVTEALLIVSDRMRAHLDTFKLALRWPSRRIPSRGGLWHAVVRVWAGLAQVLNGPYPDLSSGWFRDVGGVLVLNILGVPVVCALRVASLKLAARVRRRWAAKHALTQAELLSAYQGSDFDLAGRCGEKLMVIVVTVAFAAGLPVLVPLAAAGFAVFYWAEKYELLRVSRPPRPYSR